MTTTDQALDQPAQRRAPNQPSANPSPGAAPTGRRGAANNATPDDRDSPPGGGMDSMPAEASAPRSAQPEAGASAPPRSAGQAAPTSDAGELIHLLPLSRIDAAHDNPRGSDPGNVDRLAASIEQVGVLEPVTVTPRGDRFVLVYGHRRLAASKQAHQVSIPAIVRPMGEVERIVRQTIENTHREDLTVLQDAAAIANLRDAVAATRDGRPPGQRELAAMLGVSQSHVSKRLELLKLPSSARDAVDSGGITLEQAGKLHELVDLGLDKQAASLAKQHVAGELNDYRGQSRLVERVDAEVQEAKTRAHEAKVRAELTAAGSRVLREPKGGWWKSPVARIATGQPHGEAHCLWTGAELTLISVDDHAIAHPDSHAAALCHRHGEAVWVCTDPTVHAETEPEAAEHAAYSDQQAVAEQARRDQERQLSRAAKAREAFITKLLEQPVKVHVSDRELLGDLVLVAAERQETEAAKLTCRLLGLQPVIERDDRESARASKNYREAVRRHAENPAELGRVARALWLSQAEFRARWTYSPWSPMVPRYLDQLVAAGYTLSPVEQQRYDEAQGTVAADQQTAHT